MAPSAMPVTEIDQLLCPRCPEVVELPTLMFGPDATDMSIMAEVIEHNHQLGIKLVEHLRERHDLGLVERLQQDLRQLKGERERLTELARQDGAKIDFVVDHLRRAVGSSFTPPSHQGVPDQFATKIDRLMATLTSWADRGREAQRLHDTEPLECATNKLDRVDSYVQYLFADPDSHSDALTHELAKIEAAIAAARRVAETDGE